MYQYLRARRLARLFLLGGAAAVPGCLYAAEADAPDTIVITGARASSIEQSPATVETGDADRINETTNVINTEDAFRYLPSLLIRKRHIGDTQAPLATRTSGVGASARSLIYADGVLLSALVGNNNTFASPRWGMVSPDEIERIDVLYGPFSAAYPGNSIGAVALIATRLPEELTGSISTTGNLQHFSQYATKDDYPSWQVAATVGDRSGPFAWFLSANHVKSQSQPLAYVTVARPAGTSSLGTPATGAFEDVNRTGAPIYVIGAGGLESQQQDNLNLKLALDLSSNVRLTYLGGLFLNDTDAHARSYLTAAGAPIYAGALNINGRLVNVPATAFSNNVYSLEERHWMQALTLDGTGHRLQWQVVASRYEFAKDIQRIPSTALPAAQTGGNGSIVKLDGTGWFTFDAKALWKPQGGGHEVGFGGHFDRFTLSNNRFSTADWIDGSAGTLVQSAQGHTRTAALWLQDRITLAPTVALTLGARYEWWRAYDGFNFSLDPAKSVNQPIRTSNGLSPKASLRWTADDHWSVTLSAGQAYRFPTVSELYQAITTGPNITIPDPTLKPERARSAELAAEWNDAGGHVRLSLFGERIANALISQTAPLVPGSPTLFSYVQNIPKVRTHGIELAFEHTLFTPQLILSGSLTLADPKIIDDPAFPAAEGKMIPQVPRRRATLLVTWRPGDSASFTAAARYASRSFGTIDNSDIVGHTYQGFESWLVFDARASFRIDRHWQAAVGADNIGARKYFLFHPFPQRSLTAELAYRW